MNQEKRNYLYSFLPLLKKFGPKFQNYLFKMKFVTLTTSNNLTLMVMFNIFALDQKYSFWSNLTMKNSYFQ